MKKNLVLVGGGHAHLTVMANIHRFVDRGHQVTLAAPSFYHYYSGMGPGMLGGFYRPEEIRFPIKKIAAGHGAVFIKEPVSLIHPEKRILFCASGRILPYDVVSFNIGSQVPATIVSRPLPNVLPVKPIENLRRGQRLILDLLRKKKPQIVTIGGGPAGVEVSGNTANLVHGRGEAEIKLLAGSKLLPGLPGKARRIAASSLGSRGIEVVERARAKRISENRIHLSDGRELPYDVCFMATGLRPPALFAESGLPTGEEGGLSVNRFLQSIRFPRIFGGGDCIDFVSHPLNKVGVYAVRQNPVLNHNLLAALEDKPLKPFKPGRDYFLILNLGDGRGLFWRRSWVWDGKLAFFIKNFIDRRFMRKFSV